MKFSMMLLLTLWALNSFAINKVIYGNDDRQDLYNAADPVYVEWAHSTAAMIDSSDIRKVGNSYQLLGKTLGEDGVCSSERFINQITSASCSGFLVAPDLLVTAGHCMQYNSDCAYNYWVFDYSVFNPGEGASYTIPSSKVYRCKKVIELQVTYTNDYALVRLDRAVTDRPYLPIREKGKISNGTPLVIIGHPTGLPTKIADNAKVKKNSHQDYFVANLDSFGGNSGSAVFNGKTGEVEGILVRGETDYDWIKQNGNYCKVPHSCSDSLGLFSSCEGEEVTRITNIAALY